MEEKGGVAETSRRVELKEDLARRFNNIENGGRAKKSKEKIDASHGMYVYSQHQPVIE